jgi:hypothetical protein
MKIDGCYLDWRILWTERELVERQGSASTAASAWIFTASQIYFKVVYVEILMTLEGLVVVSKYARRLNRRSIYRTNEEMPIAKVNKREKNWTGRKQRVPGDLIQLLSCLVIQLDQPRPTTIPRATQRRKPGTEKRYADVLVDSLCLHRTWILIL